ncbi:MAG: hypothetical protein HY720_16200 [Planctomycetes bacterium]|nr:hypothetical protein [Planctomycetota bacterium]
MNPRFARSVLAPSVFLLLATPAGGQGDVPPAGAWIASLASDDYHERVRAEGELRLAGAGAVPALRIAADSCDAEVSYRSRRILAWIEEDRALLQTVRAYSPWPAPELWRRYSSGGTGRAEALCRAVGEAGEWRNAVAVASFLDWRGDADAIEREFARLYASSPSGIERQNVLFLVAHAHPQGREFCRAVADGVLPGDEDDRAEARLALAMGGDGDARRALESNPRPSAAFLGDRGAVPDLETYFREVEDPGDRERLAAYRAAELLLGQSYFHQIEFLFREAGGYGESPLREMPFLESSGDRERARAFVGGVRLFLSLFPGHPGSDNLALHAADRCMETLSAPREAAMWLFRAIGSPDGDVRGAAEARLAVLLYVLLDVPELDRLAFEVRAGEERDSVDRARLLVRCRAGDPEGALALAAKLQGGRVLPAAQLGHWRRWVELREEVRRADPHRRAELLYKIAALFYHNPGILSPPGVSDTVRSHDFLFEYFDHERPVESAARRLDWLLATHHLARAAAVFEEIRRDHPDAKVMDRTLFSLGLCYHKMKDSRAFEASRWYFSYLGKRGEAHEPSGLTRRHVEAFQELVRRFPESTLADDAQRSIEYQTSAGNYVPASVGERR